jgi:hypothetical protein
MNFVLSESLLWRKVQEACSQVCAENRRTSVWHGVNSHCGKQVEGSDIENSMSGCSLPCDADRVSPPRMRSATSDTKHTSAHKNTSVHWHDSTHKHTSLHRNLQHKLANQQRGNDLSAHTSTHHIRVVSLRSIWILRLDTTFLKFEVHTAPCSSLFTTGRWKGRRALYAFSSRLADSMSWISLRERAHWYTPKKNYPYAKQECVERRLRLAISRYYLKG